MKTIFILLSILAHISLSAQDKNEAKLHIGVEVPIGEFARSTTIGVGVYETYYIEMPGKKAISISTGCSVLSDQFDNKLTGYIIPISLGKQCMVSKLFYIQGEGGIEWFFGKFPHSIDANVALSVGSLLKVKHGKVDLNFKYSLTNKINCNSRFIVGLGFQDVFHLHR